MDEMQISLYRLSLDDFKRLRRGAVVTIARPGLIPFVLMLNRDALGAESNNGAGAEEAEAQEPARTRPAARSSAPTAMRYRVALTTQQRMVKALLRDGSTAGLHLVPKQFAKEAGYRVPPSVFRAWAKRENNGKMPKLRPACYLCKPRKYFDKFQQIGQHMRLTHAAQKGA